MKQKCLNDTHNQHSTLSHSFTKCWTDFIRMHCCYFFGLCCCYSRAHRTWNKKKIATPTTTVRDGNKRAHTQKLQRKWVFMSCISKFLFCSLHCCWCRCAVIQFQNEIETWASLSVCAKVKCEPWALVAARSLCSNCVSSIKEISECKFNLSLIKSH